MNQLRQLFVGEVGLAVISEQWNEIETRISRLLRNGAPR